MILVEGLSGSGKTTMARRIADRLAERGVPARAYVESDPDSPISIGPIIPDLSGAVMRYAERSDFLEDWTRLAERVRAEDRVLLVESRLIQNAAMFLALAGASAEDVGRHTAQIVECIRDLEPLLLYLRVSEPEAHAERALDESPREWVELALREFERTSWLCSRALEGREGWLAFFRHWGPQLDAIVRSLQIDVLTLTDPSADWDSALEQALDAISGRALPSSFGRV